MKIGITCHMINQTNSLFSNGLNYNCYLWYKLFKDVFKYNTFMLISGKTDNIILNDEEINFIGFTKDNIADFSHVFVISWTNKLLEDYRNLYNYKLIKIQLGHTYQLDQQNIVDTKFTLFNDFLDYDELWMSEHFEYSKHYIQARYNISKVYVCPYLWEPYLINTMNLPTTVIKDFTKLNIAILEPNLNYGKTSLIPIAICEKANQFLNKVYVFCSIKLKTDTFFSNYIKSTNLFKNKQITFEARWPITTVLSKHCNCIISTVEKWDLNYTYLESFYLGIPLIHNSKILKEFGYYYPEIDVDKAAELVKTVLLTHNRDEYIAKNKKALEKYSMFNKVNQSWIKNRLENPDIYVDFRDML